MKKATSPAPKPIAMPLTIKERYEYFKSKNKSLDYLIKKFDLKK